MPSCTYENVIPPLHPKRNAEQHVEYKKRISKNEWEVSLLSRLVWQWMSPLIWTGYRRPIEPDDLGEIAGNDSAEYCLREFEKRWVGESTTQRKNQDETENVDKKKDGKRDWWSLGRAATMPRIKPMAIAGVSKLVGDMLGFVAPICLSLLLDWMALEVKVNEGVEDGDALAPEYVAFLYGVAIFVANSFESLLLQQHHHLVIRSGIQVRSTIVQAIFEKSLRVPQSVLDDPESGASMAVTLQSNDAEKLMYAYYFIHYIWAAPLQTVIALYLLYTQLGVSAFVGFTAMVLLVPIQVRLGDYLKKLNRSTLKLTDTRIGFVKELLSGMKLIKLNTFESGFTAKINQVREKELAIKWKIAVVSGLNQALLEGGPVLVAVLTFAVYTQVSSTSLTASKAFTSLNLFAILRLPLAILPLLTRTLASAVAALERIAQFLQVDDFVDYRKIETKGVDSPRSQQHVVNIENATFRWSTTTSFKLSNVSVQIPSNKFTVVVGKVGSGKSALLSALMGEMHLDKGSVVINTHPFDTDAGIAYCSQAPFIVNATLKQNVTMGIEPIDEQRYQKAVWASALEDDIRILPGGHDQEIGDRGVTLSGGQKARVSIARALYRENVYMYVFDSVLSAVDAMVANQILQRCIFGMLKNRTVVLATHRESLIPIADCVLRVSAQGADDDGEVVSSVSMQLKHVPAGSQIQKPALLTPVGEVDTTKNEVHSSVEPELDTQGDGKLVNDEHREIGSVKAKYFMAYLKFFGYASAVVIMLLIAGRNGAMVGTDWWLGEWSTLQGNQTTEYYLNVYVALGASQIVVVSAFSLSFALWALRAARGLHNETLHSVIRAPMSFYSETPAGRVLNRFSNDVANVDERLPEVASSFILISTQVLVVFGVQIAALPVMAIAVVVLTFVYYWILVLYRANYREINRIVNVTKSPIYSQLSESLNGVTTLRAFRDTKRLQSVNVKLVDVNAHAFWTLNLVNRWLGLRLDWMGAVIVLVAVMVSIVLRAQVSVGIIGLVLSYSLGITRNLNWVVRQATEAESAMNAIERLVEYTQLESEAPEVIDDNRPPKEWPENGAIEFQKVSLRYRANLPLALDEVSLKIQAGTKVGVCGRTGSGKSTLLSALFRLVELEHGTMFIDNVNICEIGLKDLRSKIALVPQDPLLFQGTLRYNLDMEGSFSDDQLWQALEFAGVKDAVLANKLEADDASTVMSNEQGASDNLVIDVGQGLDLMVREGGSNWSSGERQLLCCARILLKRETARVIALDEATSSIDEETDSKLSDALSQHFMHATVITVAHRLNTIVSRCDTIVVMEAGKIAEVGSPDDLKKIPDGLFTTLVNEFSQTQE